jgi:hypothetical protein
MTSIDADPPTEDVVPADGATPPAVADDAWEELPGRPVRKRLGPVSIILAACLAAAGFFYAGVRVEKSKVGSSSGTSGIAALAARFGAAARAGGTGAGAAGAAGGFGGAARAGTTGTITLIDGNNVYVTETGGTIVKVATGPGTTISVASTGTVANLHPGDTVTVTGPAGSDGTVTATNLRDLGAGAGGGGARGGGAAAGGAAAGG